MLATSPGPLDVVLPLPRRGLRVLAPPAVAAGAIRRFEGHTPNLRATPTTGDTLRNRGVRRSSTNPHRTTTRFGTRGRSFTAGERRCFCTCGPLTGQRPAAPPSGQIAPAHP